MLRITMLSDDSIDNHDAILDSLIHQGYDDIEIEEIPAPAPRSFGNGGPKRKKSAHGSIEIAPESGRTSNRDMGDSFPGEE